MLSNKPIFLKPALKDYIWGGRRLVDEYGIETNLDKVSEAWELSTHPDGESVVSSGEFASLKLSEYISKNGDDCLGARASAFEFFPILIKLIDAADSLSVQVHPSDEYALTNEGQYGKTEMWYVVDCDDGAYLYYGFDHEISKDEFKERIENNTLLDVLGKKEVHKGDVFFIPSGTIHAIGKGILICEVQQNSNLTYRVYDYDRRDKNGNARELHVQKAMRVTDLTVPKDYTLEGNMLAKSKYFSAERVSGNCELPIDDGSFRNVVITTGFGKMQLCDTELDFKKGDSIFIPAQNGVISFKGDFEAIVSYV